MCLGAASRAVTVRIDYDAPADCGGPLSFRRALQRRFPGARVVVSSERGISLRVRLSETGSGVRGQLWVEQMGGGARADLREVRGAACTEVVEALALTAVLAIEELSETSGVGPAESPSSEGLASTGDSRPPSGAPSLSPTHDPSSSPTAAHREQHWYSRGLGDSMIAATGFVGQTVAPTVSVGLGAELRTSVLVTRSWAPTVGVGLLHAPSGVLQPAADASVGWTALTLHVCPARVQTFANAALSACALASGGWVSVAATSTSTPVWVRRSWWGAGMLLRLEVPLHESISLELASALQAPAIRRRFVTRYPSERIAETPSLTWLAASGVAYSF